MGMCVGYNGVIPVPPKYIFSYEKEGCPLAATGNQIMHFCKFRLKSACNYAYLTDKMHNFLRQGALRAASPLQPPPPASGTPMNASRKRSACSLHSQLLELPHPQCCKSSKPFVPSRVPERSRPKEGGGKVSWDTTICLRSRVGRSRVMLWEGNLEIPLRAHWPPSVSPKGWFCMLPLDPQNSSGIRGKT